MNNIHDDTAPLVVAERGPEADTGYATSSATHTILIIDDDLDTLEVLAWTLEEEGYTVAAVTSGREALQWVQAAEAVGEPPALILLDLALPGMNGSQVATALSQKWGGKASPIIIISATQSAHLYAQEMGAACTLTKPFDVNRVLQLVKQLAG
ncbi:MAG TPA: response regulator [Ktedonobacterales bacterium]|nr:response regulator [Ktedonobacterales bacterium]